MSEREPTQEPLFKLNIQKEGELTEFLATRDNASLYRHIGQLAIYNHAYFDLGDNLCTRIWRHDDAYGRVEAFMLKNDYVLHDNLRSVNQHDADAYDKMIERQTLDADTVPEDW